MGDLKCWFNAF